MYIKVLFIFKQWFYMAFEINCVIGIFALFDRKRTSAKFVSVYYRPRNCKGGKGKKFA